MMNMKALPYLACYCIALLLPVQNSDAFAIKRTTATTTALPLKQRASTDENEQKQNLIAIDPMKGYKGVDMKRAKDCADHFGKCSVEEMEELKENLHKERLQKFMFSNPSTTEATKAWEDSIEHRLLEEELDLQLSMLRNEEELHHGPNLFPEVEPPMEELPHLKDGTEEAHVQEIVHKAEVALAEAETVMEESVLETVAFCAVIAAMVLAPHFFNTM